MAVFMWQYTTPYLIKPYFMQTVSMLSWKDRTCWEINSCDCFDGALEQNKLNLVTLWNKSRETAIQ